MALTREQSLIWQAMNIGPQWILRSDEDPLQVCAPKAETSPSEVVHKSSAFVSASTIKSATPATVLRKVSSAQPVRTPALNRNQRLTSPSANPVVAVVPDEALVNEVKTAAWDDIAKIVDRCHACSMAGERTHTVIADGAPGCPIVIVGEAPGRDEDIEGVPFVGKSGQLLTALLDAVGLKRRKDVAIVNVLKCRPQKNRNPRPDEIVACSAFLHRQLELLQPKVLLLMGNFAAHSLLGKTESVSKLRGEVYTVKIAGRDVPALVSFHPSYLLRTLVDKEKGWHDVLRARKLLESLEKSQ